MIMVMEYMSEYSGMIVAALVFTVVQAACDLALPGYMADIVDIGVIGGNIDYIVQTGIKMLLFTIGITVAAFLVIPWEADASKKILFISLGGTIPIGLSTGDIQIEQHGRRQILLVRSKREHRFVARRPVAVVDVTRSVGVAHVAQVVGLVHAQIDGRDSIVGVQLMHFQQRHNGFAKPVLGQQLRALCEQPLNTRGLLPRVTHALGFLWRLAHYRIQYRTSVTVTRLSKEVIRTVPDTTDGSLS